MMTDPIADMLTRIRNASSTFKDEVCVPHSKIKAQIASILKEEGFIEEVATVEKPKMLKLKLKYIDHKSVILGLHRLSKPGRKLYRSHDQLPRIRQGMGRVILSTSSGLMTDRTARQKKIGGELLFEIY